MKKLEVTGYVASELDIQKEVFEEIGGFDYLYEGDEGANERAVLNAWDGKRLLVTEDNLAQMRWYAIEMSNMYDYQIEEGGESDSALLREYKLLRSGFSRLHDRLGR